MNDELSDEKTLQPEVPSPAPATAPPGGTALPVHGRGRAILFTLLVLLAVILNGACGIVTYSLYSGGAILQDLYNYLASHDLSFFAWVAAGVGLAGTLVSLAAYILSFDYRRPARPYVRLWLLMASFAVFLAGLILGWLGVKPDNIPTILGAGVLCALFPVPVILLERGFARGAVKSAIKFLSTHSFTSARASARTALVLHPGRPQNLITYGLALAATGRHAQALPYLVFAETHEDTANPAITLALADAWEDVGEPLRTIHYLDALPADSQVPGLMDRRVRLWLQNDQEEKALNAIAAMTPQERKSWREQYVRLLTARRDRTSLHRLASEIHADDAEPYDATVSVLKEILALFPNDLQALTELVEIQKELKQPDTVAALQEELLRLDENQIDVRRQLINYYWERGNRQALLRHLNRIMMSGQATTAEKLRLLEETYTDGDFLRVEEIVSQEPDLANNPRALFILASTLFDGGREAEALERIQQARRVGADDGLTRNLDSLSARIKKEQLDKGLATLEERVALSPGDLDLKFDFLDHLVASRAADRVVVQLDDLLKVQPELQERVEKEIRVMLSRHGKNRRLMDYLGDLYLRRRDYDTAYELFERRAQGEINAPEALHDSVQKILTLCPDHAPSLQSEMRFYHQQGQAEEALAAYDKMPASAASADAELRRLEMDSAEKSGDIHRALTAGQTLLLDHAPQDTALMARLASLAVANQDYPRAIELLKEATSLDSDSFELRRQLRSTVETMKRARLEEVKSELAARPGNRDLLEEQGDILHDFDQLNDAIASYQRAGLNDPERRVPKAKLGYLLARKGLFTDADEALQEADLRSDLPEDEQEKLKNLFFITAGLMEEEAEEERALQLYRRIFRVDAGYREVVNHIERLQTTARKKKSTS